MGRPLAPLAPAELWRDADAEEADRFTIDELGIPSAVLMERVALGAARVLVGRWSGRPVQVLCGPGHNGGDGFALARILHGWGVPVQAHVLRGTERNAEQLRRARACGVTCVEGPPSGAPTGLVVDAMLGTGASGSPRGVIAEALRWCREAAAEVLAIDAPTGLDAERCVAHPDAIRAACTVAVARSRPCLHMHPTREHAGEVVVLDVGIQKRTGARDVGWALIEPSQAWECWARPEAAHKGERGHVLVYGGSEGLEGAAILAARAAMAAGAGLATLWGSSSDARALMLRVAPELMSGQGEDASACVVGPGLAEDESVETLAQDTRPAVWDAGGLAAFARRTAAGPRVLTPHPSEAARMLTRLTGRDWSTAEVQRAREFAVRELVAATGAVVVLKGAATLVSDGRCVAIDTTGTDALATAGSGDCLAGAIAALLARGVAPFEAACAAVWAHGTAGRALPSGGVASDLVTALGRVQPCDVGYPRLMFG